MSKRQIPFSVEKTTFLYDSPEGLGARYLDRGDIPKRECVKMMLRSLWAPLEAALSSMSEAEVEALITAADRLHQLTMDNARAAIVRVPKEMESKVTESDSGANEVGAGEDFGDLFGD